MAISFDETNDYYSIVDSASMTLPAGDWCVGIWTKVDDNSGNLYQYLISTGGISTTNNSFAIYLQEVDAPNSNVWSFFATDEDGGSTGVQVDATPTGGDGVWRLIIVQRDTGAGEVQIWFCELGGVATKEDSTSDAGLGVINGGEWDIGQRATTPANRYYGSTACEFFKLDFALTQSEIEALGSGMSPSQLGKKLDVYLPMIQADATLLDLWGDNDATRNDAPITVEHPRVLYPIPPFVL